MVVDKCGRVTRPFDRMLIMLLFGRKSVSFKKVVVVPAGGRYFSSLEPRATSLFLRVPKGFRPKNPKTGIIPEFGIYYIRGAPLRQTDR